MRTCFSEGKLMKQFGNPPLSKRTPPPPPPFQLTHLFQQFFQDPTLCSNFKNKNPPHLIQGGGGDETMGYKLCSVTSLKSLKDLF